MQSLIDSVKQVGVHLWLDKNQLRYRSSSPASAGEALSLVRKHKAEIVDYLQSLQTPEFQALRAALNLDDGDRTHKRFPVRVELMWRKEMEKNGYAPAIPFQINYSRLFRSGTDIDRLARSLNSVVGRHDALRSRLVVTEGRPAYVPDATASDIEIVKIPGDILQRESETLCAAEKILKAPIDLRGDLSARCRIFIDANGNAALGIAVHHYFFDHWSLKVLLKELEALYAGRVLPSIESQYDDYSAAQRAKLSETLCTALKFWDAELNGRSFSRLPYDHQSDSDRMQPLFFTIGVRLVARIRALAQSIDKSMFEVLLTAFLVMLSKWNQCESVVTAVSVADRTSSKYSDTIGYLISAVPVSAVLSDQLSFDDAVDTISKKAKEAYQFKDLSYEFYDEVSAQEGSFCTTLFNYVPLDRVEAEAGGANELSDEDIQFYPGSSFARQMHHRELYMQLVELSTGFRGKVFLNTGYFRAETVETLMCSFASLLSRVCDDPEIAIGQI